MELEQPNKLGLDLALAIRRADNGYLVIDFKVANFQGSSRTADFGLVGNKHHRLNAIFAVDGQRRAVNFNDWPEDAVAAHKILAGRKRTAAPVAHESTAWTTKIFMILFRPAVRKLGLHLPDENSGAEYQNHDKKNNGYLDYFFKQVAVDF